MWTGLKDVWWRIHFKSSIAIKLIVYCIALCTRTHLLDRDTLRSVMETDHRLRRADLEEGKFGIPRYLCCQRGFATVRWTYNKTENSQIIITLWWRHGAHTGSFSKLRFKVLILMIYSHSRLITRELLCELKSRKMGTEPILKLFSSHNSSRNRRFESADLVQYDPLLNVSSFNS